MTILKTAKFNDDTNRTHRYFLGRMWEQNHSKIMFIGVNPSTADETDDDRTVGRLTKFSMDWGFGGFYIANLYPFISKDPDEMMAYYRGLGSSKKKTELKLNNHTIFDRVRICSMVVFCWGASVDIDDPQVRIMTRRIRDARCFGKTKDGHPKHPLYLPSHTQLIKY